MKPPAWAQLVLWAVAGENEAEFVAGDLHEEFLLLCAAHGRSTGSRWYVRQVLRSAATLLGLRFRSGEAAHLVAAALVLWADHVRTIIEDGERKVAPLCTPAAATK